MASAESKKRGGIEAIFTKRQHLENHEAPGDDFHPAALVSGLGEKVVPEILGVMLGFVEDQRGDLWYDVVLRVVAQDKRHGLAFVYLYSSNQAWAKATLALDLSESDLGRAGSNLAPVQRDI
jgi:hypothetical protein